MGSTAPTDGEKVWFEKGKNLLNTNSMVMGDLRNETGEEVANTNGTHYRSGFIKVLPNTQYTFTTNYTFPSGGVTKLMEYANDKTFIQRSPASSLNQVITFTTSNTTYYLRICMFSYAVFTDFYSLENMLSLGTDTSYEPYIEPSINVDEEEWYNPNNIEKYSTNEIKIGTWIDGKPLYKKVITFGALANNGNKVIPYGSSNNLIKFDIYAKNPTGGYLFKVPLGGTNYINSYVDLNSHQIVVQTNSDRTAVTDNYAIVEYTKTID